MEQKQKTIVKILARLCGTAVFIAFLGWFCIHLWTVANRNGMMTTIINDPHFEVYVFSVGGGLLGLFALGICLIWRARRDVTLISLAAFILFMSPLGWVKSKEWLAVGRFDTISMVEDLTVFRPFAKKNILVKLDKPLEKRMEGKQPRIDGVMNMFRFYASIVENVCRQDGWMAESEAAGAAFGRLFNDEADVVFSGLPPQSVAAKAASQGKTLDTTMVVKDAFVFYVHAGNPVDNLSLEQIKQIYGGKATDWKDVGSKKKGAIEAFQKARILFAPGKAVNAGGVATSGLEMSQNAMHISWKAEEVDQRLHGIMDSIHKACVKYGTQPDGYINYVKGANVAGFMKVAEATGGSRTEHQGLA